MEIYSKGLNKNEIFCCSKKEVKAFFKESEITVNYGVFGGRMYENGNFGNSKKKVYLGKIVAKLGILNVNDAKSHSAMFSLYVLKEEDITEEQKKEFVKTIMPIIYKKFKEREFENPEKVGIGYSLLIELLNNKFILHENIL